MTITVAKTLIAHHRAVRALSRAVGIAVEDEPALEQRTAHRVQRMMDDAIAKRGGGYDPMLRFKHLNLPVASGSVGSISELLFKPQHLELLTGEKRRYIAPDAFSFGSPVRCFQEGSERGDPVKKITLFHGCGEFSARRRSGARYRQASVPQTHGGADPDTSGRGKAAIGNAASQCRDWPARAVCHGVSCRSPRSAPPEHQWRFPESGQRAGISASGGSTTGSESATE